MLEVGKTTICTHIWDILQWAYTLPQLILHTALLTAYLLANPDSWDMSTFVQDTKIKLVENMCKTIYVVLKLSNLTDIFAKGLQSVSDHICLCSIKLLWGQVVSFVDVIWIWYGVCWPHLRSQLTNDHLEAALLF